jgi:uncharacterized protein
MLPWDYWSRTQRERHDEVSVSGPPVSESPAQRQSRAALRLAGGGAALGVLLVTALAGQLGSLFGAAFSLGQLPLLALAALGWLAPRSTSARAGSLLLLYAAGVLLAGITVALAGVTLVDPTLGPRPRRSEVVEALIPALLPLIGALGALLVLPALLLLRGVRVALARVLPLDPDTFRHWLGLVALVWFTLMPIASMPLLGGQPPMQALIERSGGLDEGALPVWYDSLYGLGWTLVLCLGAVGYPAWVRLGPALARLGLTWPGWRAILAGIALSVLMVPVFLGVDALAAVAVESVGLARTSSAWIEQLFGRGFGVSGALAAALAAGLGEELIWRGVIQPRYGLVLAALGFAAMHGFQYGPDGLISVLIAGLVLGLVRQRSNTTTAAVVHGGYDLWLLLGTLLHWF